MGLISNSIPTADLTADQESRAEVVAYYRQVRKVSRELTQKLVDSIPPDILEEGGKRLGIYRRGAFLLHCEEEISVLMDYCLYHVRRHDLSLVERYRLESAPDEDSDEMVCLRAAEREWYSAFSIRRVLPGFGIRVEDLLSGETLDIVDINLSRSTSPQFVFLSRILPHDRFFMTGGASIPIGIMNAKQRSMFVQAASQMIDHDRAENPDPAPLIRECLECIARHETHYVDPSEEIHEPQSINERTAPVAFSKNMKCPCGSGRKYKHCCMRR